MNQIGDHVSRVESSHKAANLVLGGNVLDESVI